MQQTDKDISSIKENSKVDGSKSVDDNDVKEGQADSSIYSDNNDKSAYPFKHAEDKQHKDQEEYIDRNSETKDKS